VEYCFFPWEKGREYPPSSKKWIKTANNENNKLGSIKE
jgi:hypothetical protein